MKEKIKKILIKTITEIGATQVPDFAVEEPKVPEHGDYSTNVAMVLSKQLGKPDKSPEGHFDGPATMRALGGNPNEIANLIKEKIKIPLFEKVEVVGGFINFYLAKEIFIENIKNILKNPKDFGKNNDLKNKKVILDYTDPNPFKDFHIGHIMSNAIGESLSRLFEFQNARVKRVCYQGDVGIHVAKAIWGAMQNKNNFPNASSSEEIKIKFLSIAYVFGAEKFETDETAKKEITELNKIIFERSDKKINHYYDIGKKWSLEHFDKIYKRLGTKFDWLIFESQVAELGKKAVLDGLKKGVFENGENNAIIFKGEKFGLHTRVFINSMGLPTYEAKDFGLAQLKYKKYAYDKSVVITGNEVNEYFKVMLRAMQEVLPQLAEKTNHIGHGMLRLPEGKMSSRTGKAIPGELLLDKLETMVKEKIKDRNLSEKEKREIAQKVAVSAIKYSVLKQSTGSDVIYDFEKSVSFAGDSGPYLQYSFTRAISVLEKAKKEKIKSTLKIVPEKVSLLGKLMMQFPEIVAKSGAEYQPHYLATYLTQLAGAFNSFYAENKIVDKADKFSPYKVAVTQAFTEIMKNGLWLLGIQTLNKM